MFCCNIRTLSTLIFALTLGIMSNGAAHAQDSKGKQPPGSKQMSPGAQDVEINGKKVGSIRLASSGDTRVTTLASGQSVTLRMKNGKAVSARVVGGSGASLPAVVHEDAVRRTIVIIIHDGGTVIVIVIRTRAAAA